MLLQIIFILGLLSAVPMFISKKQKEVRVLKKSEKGFIELRDGIYLNNQINAFLFEIEGNKIFTVASNNGIQSIKLEAKERKYKDELTESMGNSDGFKGRDDGIYDKER